MRSGVGVATVLFVSGVAAAGDAARPTAPVPSPSAAARPASTATPEQAADAVLAAVVAKDDAALRRLASNDVPDPWIVVEELLARGQGVAAAAFARASPRKDVERLPVYVDSQRDRAVHDGLRSALATATKAVDARRFEDAVAASRGGLRDPARPDDSGVTVLQLQLALALSLGALGRGDESTSAYRSIGESADRIGWYSLATQAFYASGSSAWDRSEFGRALESWERGLAVARARARPAATAVLLANMGSVHAILGGSDKALALLREAIVCFEAAADRRSLAAALGNLGNALAARGELAAALAAQERALQIKEEIGDVVGASTTLGNLGNLHHRLNDPERAIASVERAVKLKRDLGDRLGASIALANLGGMLAARGDGTAAEPYLRRAVVLAEEVGDRAALGRALSALASSRHAVGKHAEALEQHERALTLLRAVGDRPGAAMELGSIAQAHHALGRTDKAIEGIDRAVKEAEQSNALSLLATTLGLSVRWRLEAGDSARALADGRRALGVLDGTLVGLGDQQGSVAREQYAPVLAAAVAAALETGSSDDAYRFLEAGRARSLLEALGGRLAIREAMVPTALRVAETEARIAEARALGAYHRAVAAGGLKEARDRLTELDAERGRVEAVVARIEREAKAAAGLAYPRTPGLPELKDSLAAGEALVLYGSTLDRLVALVVTRQGARSLWLPRKDEVAAACASLHETLSDAAGAMDAAKAEVGVVRLLVADSLALGDAVDRVLVSPCGEVAYAPFALLFPGRDVAYVPSATTLHLLGERSARSGEGTLALGDPDYDAVGGAQRADTRSRLPETAVEAKAIGDLVLLGRDATKDGFAKALAARGRWRAVHFACHGLVDPDRPMLSALALTPTATDDGLLACRDVVRTTLDADLVCLSACETAKGKVLGEGVLGFSRAFMLAGTPRVLCSLWKVDDEATRALMVKFYDLWNPKDGKPGLPTATALKQAQEFVRSHEKWKHPYYWAAWVLWGLPS
jgi:tetratricopeptide (TPR) repeat protein